jgi:uncharacterized membrane protein
MKKYETRVISIIRILSHHTISYQGGGDYRGIYDTGLKGALEGYIGLLLNAPYKIDSMVWMRLGLCSLVEFKSLSQCRPYG